MNRKKYWMRNTYENAALYNTTGQSYNNKKINLCIFSLHLRGLIVDSSKKTKRWIRRVRQCLKQLLWQERCISYPTGFKQQGQLKGIICNIKYKYDICTGLCCVLFCGYFISPCQIHLTFFPVFFGVAELALVLLYDQFSRVPVM